MVRFASIALAGSLVLGQAVPLPQFDVASVKPNTLLEQPSNNWRVTPGRTDYHNSQLIELIRLAWGDFQLRVENGPDWITRGRFDVVVQYPADTPRAATGPMMRTLLTDRFKLAAHLEPREVPTYSLVLARADRRLGPRLTSPLAECPLANGTIPPPGSGPACGPGVNQGSMRFGNIRIANIALYLSRVVGRRVIDNTGLTDPYKIDLKFTPPQVLAAAASSAGAPPAPLPEPEAPDVFVALQEQLGLKLEDANGQIQVLVIDHVEQPTPD